LLPLSVAIITKDEADNLPRLLESLKPLNPAEIVVVDSGSTDNTVQIAKAYGARVVETDWPGFVEQKNRALLKCRQPWVLSLDADEPMSESLAKEIRTLLTSTLPTWDGYEINRRTYYLGKCLQHTWQPEWRLRLVKQGKGCWVGGNVHEHIKVEGRTSRLTGILYHYSYKDLKDHFERMIEYARLGAESTPRQTKFPWYKLLTSPALRFLKILIIQGSWRDGWRGLIIATTSMIAAFMKYSFIYERSLTEKKRAQNNETKL
jgi:glycosyltransferase involved in cell wall biosynthesis